MLGLFPLTIRLGVILFFCISFSIASFNYLFLNLPITTIMHQLWQHSLFGGVAIWLQLGQLSMLMKLYRESTIDPLTGLINRRVLMRQLDYVCSQNMLNNEPCSLMILDLDKFKRVNDEFGHQSGDRVLRALSSILTYKNDKKQIAARFGGEEFVLFMPNTKLDKAIDKANHIAKSVRKLRIKSDNGKIINITTSIGISQLKYRSSPEELIRNADELLYKAKLEGRDCIRY
jgi:diguanylate cyclase (GGDEF)-like protein